MAEDHGVEGSNPPRPIPRFRAEVSKCVNPSLALRETAFKYGKPFRAFRFPFSGGIQCAILCMAVARSASVKYR